MDRSDQDLAEARNRQLAAILDATPDFVGLARPDGSVVFINEAGRRMLRVDTADPTELNVRDFLSPAVMHRLQDEIIPHAIQHGTWTGHAMFGWDENEIPVSQVVLVHRDLAGRVEYISTIARDISDTLRSERTLWQREAQASMLAALSQQALAVTDLRSLFDAAVGGITAVLDVPLAGVAERLPDGYSFMLRAAVGIGRDAIDNLVIPSEADGPAQTAIRTGRPYLLTDASLAGMKAARWFIDSFGSRSGVIVRVGTGERPFGILATFSGEPDAFTSHDAEFIQAVAGVLANAIERRRTEVDLQRSQRLKALGRFAGGLAHDFNNLLAVMLGHLEVIVGRNDDPAVATAAQEAVTAGRQAAALLDQLTNFSADGESTTEGTDLNTVLTNLEPAVRELAAAGVEVVFEPAGHPLPVIADEQRLRQAVRHVVVNAVEAMPESGTLTVRAYSVAPSAAAGQGLAQEPFVCLEVVDTGPGMDEETVSHLFEPYFTTRQPATGRGLGLPATYGIVTEAGGTVQVETEPGRGTTVMLWWPMVSPDATPSAQAQAPSTVAEETTARVTLLLVEDQAAIRSLLASVLGDRGYTVLEATNGIEALDLARGHDRPIDVVVTDVVMPQMSGPDMVAQLREADPALAVLYVSGFHQDAVTSGDQPAPTAFLRKPFGIAQLASTVTDLLNARKAESGG